MVQCPLLGVKRTCHFALQMSAYDGGLNRSTQHSISFYLLGFEPQGLARTASDAKVPGFSAAVKPRKNPRRFVAYSVFPLQDRECCVDRLNRPPKADIPILSMLSHSSMRAEGASGLRCNVLWVPEPPGNIGYRTLDRGETSSINSGRHQKAH